MVLPAGMRPPGHRIERQCGGCGAWDTHPHHVHVNELGMVTSRHLDCCAQAGCPDGSCPPSLADAGGARGDALAAHLTAAGPNPHLGV